MSELKVPAHLDQLDSVLDFVGEAVEQTSCSLKAQTQLQLAVEEMFVNVVHYGYPNGMGSVVLRIEVKVEEPSPGEVVAIEIEDEGVPYNPLTHLGPDTSLSADERAVGGLGIYMVKTMMDEVTYVYKDHKNLLTLKKRCQT